ncbi:5-guanidino-2-oxopentanoate decarboxylase [Alpinimonas psychrophila]|uniref:Acetolactate synthase-1/2/3 large subunit n=1 Tax=Alpinimonas psychrophila TaxID=748908 RepID=A0A7W3PPK0_9MICO|nr:thiamine pyrophosphate-binding protein [Alpinimonas psychrophila]MBA8829562.1 acetolactate synthase-1/2/3 large subunit [Alpinimonas psychrophila]
MNYSSKSIASALTAGVIVDNAGRAIMTTLRNYGVDTVFGIPGTHNLELYRPLKELGIRPVTSRHEQGAGYGADGWSQQTGLPGIVITTSGPGLLNALSAAGTAYCESRPLIILSPGASEGQEFADNGALHETKNPTGAVGAIVEWSRRVHSATEAVQAVHDAFELFRYGRPRPVHIEVPLNILEGLSDCPESLKRARPVRASMEADYGDVLAAAKTLRQALRPLIIAGGGALRSSSDLSSLAELLNAPVITTLNGKAAIPEAHALSLASDIRLPSMQTFINDSDAILIVGSKLGDAELWGGTISPVGIVVRIDILESQLQKNVKSEISLVGDSSTVIRQLMECLLECAKSQPSVSFHKLQHRSEQLDSVRLEAAAEARSISPQLYSIAKAIAGALPENAIVSGDSSQITYFGMSSVVRQDLAHSFLYTPTYATLGYGLPASIGAKVASPHRPVICVLGDGALMFSIQELMTAVEQEISITVVCVDNGGYGEILQNERDRGIEPVGVVLRQPDWVELANAFGARGYLIADLEELSLVVARVINAPGVDVLHVPLHRF